MISTATNRPPNPSCRVCGGEASGFHYGVDSCEGCKGFFRRCLTQGLTNKCTNDEKCEITPVSRNSCQFCRLKKCKMVGMSKEGSRLGRRPKRLKQCHGQTNDSLPPPPPVHHKPLNDSGPHYNRMYPTNNVHGLQARDFSDSYPSYHYQQLNNNHHMDIPGYQRVIKPEPDERFMYSDQEALSSMEKSHVRYKNGTNGTFGFSNFRAVTGKTESLLVEGNQFRSTHIKQEITNCEGNSRTNYGSMENLPRDSEARNSTTATWGKNGFHATNSSSPEHLEEGEIPIKRLSSSGTPVDHKSSAWSSLNSSSPNDHWSMNNKEEFKSHFAYKKTAKNGSVFLHSDFSNIRDKRNSCSLPYNGSEDSNITNNISGVMIKRETSDDDDSSVFENDPSTFSRCFTRSSSDRSAFPFVDACKSGRSNDPNSPENLGLSNNCSEVERLKLLTTSNFPTNQLASAPDLQSNNANVNRIASPVAKTVGSVNPVVEENICKGLTKGLCGLTLQEVKGPIPHEKMELITQVIDAVTTAHSATCSYTSIKVAEGLERYKELQRAGHIQNHELNMNDIWQHFVDNMTPVIQRVVKFSKRLPGFCEIGQEDQISLIKQGSFEVILIRYTKLFRDDAMFVPNMTILVPKEVIERMPLGDFFQEQMRFANSFNELGLTDDEIGLLSAVMIVCPDRAGLQNVKAIQQLNLLFLQSLYIHMQRTRPANFNDFFDKAIEILPKIRRINEIHSIKVSDIKLSPSPEVSFPPLHEEVFDETLC